MPVTDVAVTKTPTRLAPLNVAAAGVSTGLGIGAGNGIRWADNGRRWLRVRNGGGAPITVSVLVPEVGPDGQVVPPLVANVPAAGDVEVGPFPARYRDSAGRITAEFSAIASVTYDLIERALV